MNERRAHRASAVKASRRARARTVLASVFVSSMVLVIVAIVLLRRRPSGLHDERAAMHSLSGTDHALYTTAGLLERLPLVAVAAGVLAVMALLVRSLRCRAVVALVLLGGINASAQGIKWLAGLVLHDSSATLPSGHACLALSSAAVLAVLGIGPLRWPMCAAAGAIAALGCVGVVSAYWHTPGDVVAAMALTAAWLSGVGASLSSSARHRWSRAWKSLIDFLVAAAAAGALVRTFWAWGTGINAFDSRRVAMAYIVLIAFPAAAVALVTWAGTLGRAAARHARTAD